MEVMNNKLHEEMLHAENGGVWDTETEVDSISEEKWKFLFTVLDERVRLGISSTQSGQVKF